MKLSARNQWKGTIVEIQEGAVNGQVILEVDGLKIASIITMASIKELGLEVGKEAYAVIKASNVLIGVEE